MLTYTPLSAVEYENWVINAVSNFEGHIPRALIPPSDTLWTIGYGYTFVRSNNIALWAAAGIALSPSDTAVLQAIDAAAPAQKNALAAGFSRSINLDEARSLLRQTYPQYEGPANTLSMPLSLERVAFVSITYNRGAASVQSRMQPFYAAVTAQDRAEAWFQLRYMSWGSNLGAEPGLRKRRIVEAELFGLFDDLTSIGADEAAQVFRMLQKNRVEIYRVESLWGVPADGTTGARNLIFEANRDYPAILPRAKSIFDSLAPGRNALISGSTLQKFPLIVRLMR